ncbi:MAG: hypothetical protein HXY21_09840, partial [Parvularculaceae bacterium]|nr:hypothetical protein [Parvularculaceae bacterium]
EPDDRHATAKFTRFLKRAGRPVEKSRAPAAGFLAVGALFGAAFISLAPPLAGVSSGVGLTLDLPLWALGASLGLAILYSLAGALFSAAAAGEQEADSPTLGVAVSALRKAYGESGAPRLDDLATSIEAAIGAFAERRSGGSGDANRDALSAEPAWRRPSEPPRFAPQTFAAAPPVFRADAQGGGEKIFPWKGSGNAAPKQSFKTLDPSPVLNGKCAKNAPD